MNTIQKICVMVFIGSIPMAYFGYDLSVGEWQGNSYWRGPHALLILAVFSLCASATGFFLFKDK